MDFFHLAKVREKDFPKMESLERTDTSRYKALISFIAETDNIFCSQTPFKLYIATYLFDKNIYKLEP
jgi:hypothetical protein